MTIPISIFVFSIIAASCIGGIITALFISCLECEDLKAEKISRTSSIDPECEKEIDAAFEEADKAFASANEAFKHVDKAFKKKQNFRRGSNARKKKTKHVCR